LPPGVRFLVKNAPNSISAEASPQNLLGIAYSAPQTSNWILGGHF